MMIQSQQLNDEVYRMDMDNTKATVTGDPTGLEKDIALKEYFDEQYKLHIPAYLQGFLMDIDRMNEMYRMPTVGDSYEEIISRLQQFKSILSEECDEIDTLNGDKPAVFDLDKIRINLADLLGDIIVYCASEAKRWNIPIDRVLSIIMQSNFSKLDSNGQPIYDERMKLMKGPNYWKPEPKIAQMLIEWNQKG